MTVYPMNFVLPSGLEAQLRDRLIDTLEENTFEEIIQQSVEQITHWDAQENPQLKRTFASLARIHSRTELEEIVAHHFQKLLGKHVLASDTGRDNVFAGGDAGLILGIIVGISFAIAGLALLFDYLIDPSGWGSSQ